MYRNNADYGLGVNPLVSYGLQKLKDIIGSVFGGQTMDEQHASWLAQWESEMTPEQWKWFSNWIATRFKNSDWDAWWCSNCDDSRLYYLHASAGYDEKNNDWGMIQRIANDVRKREYGSKGGLVPHCRKDWKTWDPTAQDILVSPGGLPVQGASAPLVTQAGFIGLGALALILLLSRK